MSKVRNFAEIAPTLAFSEFDFYDLYRSTFENSELGRIKRLLPLREMAENLGLVSRNMRTKLGRKSFFTPEGKVALLFLKMYTGLSCPKLLEQLNGNIHYQMFCDVIIDPTAHELQAAGRHNSGTCGQVEDTAVAGHPCREMETVHAGPGHDVHRCHLL